MKNVIISKDAINFLRLQKRLRDPQIVIYRDIRNINMVMEENSLLFKKLKVFDGKKPNKYFMKYDDEVAVYQLD